MSCISFFFFFFFLLFLCFHPHILSISIQFGDNVLTTNNHMKINSLTPESLSHGHCISPVKFYFIIVHKKGITQRAITCNYLIEFKRMMNIE